MLLRRLGNKQKMVPYIVPHFPPHTLYIELFFGAGGMFFNKPKARHNIVNDLDSEVFNLFQVVNEQPKNLEAALQAMPIAEDLWKYWRLNKESEPVRKALRFLFLSNFGFLGKAETLRFNAGNTKEILWRSIAEAHKFMFSVEFMNTDFRNVLNRIPVRPEMKPNLAFIYADPPYLDTDNNYESGFTKKDSEDLFNVLVGSGIRFAMSEFDHPFILEQARLHGLIVDYIKNRVNLKNRRTEILVKNYEINTLFK